MPELPEVETMRRSILGSIGGTIVTAERVKNRLRPIEVSPKPAAWKKNVIGKKIEDVSRLGKRVVVHVQGEQRIVFEPRMSGIVMPADPPNRTHLRFQILLSGSKTKQILFWDQRGLGSVRLFKLKEFQDYFESGRVGPDALAVSASQMKSRMEKRKTAIKPALLDQKLLAGVGNLYASELLFAAKVDPTLRCCDLTSLQWTAIHRHMNRILRKAIENEGSTLSDGTYVKSKAKDGGYQNMHRVYDKAGSLCKKCKTPIVRFVQNQRSTFGCPTCQNFVLIKEE